MVVRTWERLRQTSGRLGVGQLVDEVGCSHRHLVARFREQVGLAPKAVARVLRFQASLRLLERGGRSLADVAASAGYYDQAHLHREFRDFAGCTPSALLAARRG